MPPQLPSKLVGETITVQFNFQNQIRFGETLSAPAVAISLFSGLDNSPSDILSGSASVSDTVVSQKITAGMAGVVYTLACSVTGSTGTVYKTLRRLAVLSDNGSYAASASLSLSGDLPDGIVGAAYSHNLDINGGYLPYEPDGIAAGSAPPWMGYTVVGSDLVCAGTPDEGPITYTFSPQVADAAGTEASSDQVINITKITIAGDLGDGDLGDYVSYQYTVSLGTAPYTFDTTITGLPTGLSISASGLVTGNYAASGPFSWTVRATDANGVLDTHDDSNVVGNVTVFARQVVAGGVDIGATSSPTVWTGQPTISATNTGSVRHLLAGGGRLLSYSASQLRVSTDGGDSFSAVSIPTSSTSGYKGKYIEGKYWIPLGVNGLTNAVTPGTWTTVPVNTHADYTIAGIGDLLVRAGAVVGPGDGVNTSVSTDGGDTWGAPLSGLKERVGTASATVECIETDGIIFVAGGQDHAMSYSNNGIDWTKITSPFVNGSGTTSERVVTQIAYGYVGTQMMWIAVSHVQDDSPVGQIAYSLDGINWTLAADSFGEIIEDCAVGIGTGIIVGVNGAIKTSVNGTNWTSRASNFGANTISSVVVLVGDPLT